MPSAPRICRFAPELAGDAAAPSRAFAGACVPDRARGAVARRLLASERRGGGRRLLVAVLCHPFAAAVAADDLAPDPARLARGHPALGEPGAARELPSGRELPVRDGHLAADALFAVLPVALLDLPAPRPTRPLAVRA